MNGNDLYFIADVILQFLNEMHVFKCMFPRECQIPCKRKSILFSSSLEEPIKFVIIQTDMVSCIWMKMFALLGRIKYWKIQYLH